VQLHLGRRAAGVVALSTAALLAVAGCSGGATGSAAARTKDSPAGASPSGSASGSAPGSASNRAADFRAYTDCLQQHGVVVPTFSPRADASPRPRPSGTFVRPARSGGARNGGGFGFLGSADPSARAAMQACQSLAPQGGFGGGFGGGGRGGGAISTTTFAAFKSCMSDNGVTITQTDSQQALRSLNRSDAKTAAALKVCDPILGRPTTTPTPRSTS
jgi:hypothetical protein